MALALSKEQLTKLNKKDILQLLLESMEQEKELRSQLAGTSHHVRGMFQ